MEKDKFFDSISKVSGLIPATPVILYLLGFIVLNFYLYTNYDYFINEFLNLDYFKAGIIFILIIFIIFSIQYFIDDFILKKIYNSANRIRILLEKLLPIFITNYIMFNIIFIPLFIFIGITFGIEGFIFFFLLYYLPFCFRKNIWKFNTVLLNFSIIVSSLLLSYSFYLVLILCVDFIYIFSKAGIISILLNTILSYFFLLICILIIFEIFNDQYNFDNSIPNTRNNPALIIKNLRKKWFSIFIINYFSFILFYILLSVFGKISFEKEYYIFYFLFYHISFCLKKGIWKFNAFPFYFIPIIFLLVVSYYFGKDIYKKIPTEIGGVKPRVALLVVDTAKIQSFTNLDFFLKGNISKPLELIYQSNSKTYFRIDNINLFLENNCIFGVIDLKIELNENRYKFEYAKNYKDVDTNKLKNELLSYDIILKFDPKNYFYSLHRAHGRYYLKDYIGAQNDYINVIKYDSNCADANLNLGIINYFLGNPEESLFYLNRACENHLDPNEALIWRAIIKIDLKDTIGAQADLQEKRIQILNSLVHYLEVDIRRFQVLYDYIEGEFSLLNGDSYHSKEYFEKAFNKNPNSEFCNYGIGKLNFSQSNWNSAVAHFTKAITINPNFIYAYYNRGLAKIKLNSIHEAEKDFEKIIKLNPNFSQAYFEKGNISYKHRPYYPMAAISFYDEAIKINPNYIDAYVERGSAKYHTKDLIGSIKDWVKARTLGSTKAVDSISRYFKR